MDVMNEDEVLALALSCAQRVHPGKPIGPKSHLGQRARSLAQLVAAVLAAVKIADDNGIPARAAADAVIRSRCDSEALDGWAVTFALPSNRGPASFGRNGPVVARGGAGAVQGTVGTLVGTGAVLLDAATHQIGVELVSGLALPPAQTILGDFQAQTPGAAGNLPAGTRLEFFTPPPGLFPFVVLETGLSGGYDIESDAHLLERLINYLRAVPEGGTARQYRAWAERAEDLTTGASLGIARAYVYQDRPGVGAKDVVITLAGSGRGRDPGDVKTAKVQAFLDDVRPVNDAVKAVRPFFDEARGLRIVAQVQPSPEYPWDWQGASIPIQVASSTTKFQVLAADLAGTQLREAYINGRQPRVQIVLPESALPQVVQIVSAVPVGLVTEFTVTPALSSKPTGALMYPAGGVVVPVALSMLNYLDNLGPSKQCGFYDRITDDWEAIVTIGKLVAAALWTVDAVGQRMVSYSPAVGQGVGIQVATGAGALGGADVLLFDNRPNDGPELPWTASILVLPIG